MSKDEMVKHLREKGYKAENDNGVVMIHVDVAMTADELSKLNNEIRNSGYNSSWGVKKDG